MCVLALTGLFLTLTDPGEIDTTAIAQGIQANLEDAVGGTATVNCPDTAPAATGSTFLCIGYDQDHTPYPYTVTVHETTVTWAPRTP